MTAVSQHGMSPSDFEDHKAELAKLCLRIAEIVPCGASVLIALDLNPGPQIVGATGEATSRKPVELILINRPISFAAQTVALSLKRES